MTRYSTLLSIYQQLDTIYLAVIMVAVWVAGFGHLLDWMTQRHLTILVTIFWTLVVMAYMAAMLFIGLSFG
jgi:hypothetical protein